MWENLIHYEYEDYDLTAERCGILHALCADFQEGLVSNLEQYDENLFSSKSAWHITGTEEQSQSQLWRNLRSCRITASRFKEYATNPKRMSKDLWADKEDLSRLKSIAWGNEHESVARLAYTESTGQPVQEVGLFISKRNPLFGASPDGVIDDDCKGLLEVKCPFSLRDENLAELTKNGHFYTCHNRVLKLRHSHPYFYQVQLQMFVTGATYCDFFI
jgi:hypothetical protein